ncbi:hypothetical protein BBF96_01005 [Anoxybacter fermentans]|uniref:Uncharacterized protein n=1 Tax=Anoxybacter fermentans TaxID=1323375 RepID=A0A3Q9HNH5_9FIRM|nr:hypothetical protein [Anoxybacter fermentans]AZR72092.1 hypothetical protein BBF96_01005 [Anoxybacter fermentans]
MAIDIRNYISKVRTFLNNNYLFDIFCEDSPYPFEIIIDNNGNVTGLEIKEKNLALKTGDLITFRETCTLKNSYIYIICHKYQFCPLNPDKENGFWYFRIDLDTKHGLHGNHDDGRGNYFRNDWPHHLIPGKDIDLDIFDFNFYLFLKLTATYISQKEKYPFEKAYSNYYNQKITKWKNEIT